MLPLVFGSSFLILTISINFFIRVWTCWQHLTGFLTKSIAVLMLNALPGLICSRSSLVNSWSCCKSSCSFVFTLKNTVSLNDQCSFSLLYKFLHLKKPYMFWYLLLSQSLSNSPFVFALLTICTRIGVNSPSKANSPFANAAAVICTLPSSLA